MLAGSAARKEYFISARSRDFNSASLMMSVKPELQKNSIITLADMKYEYNGKAYMKK